MCMSETFLIYEVAKNIKSLNHDYNRLNALAMLYVHLDIHPSSEEILKRFIVHVLHRLNFHLE